MSSDQVLESYRVGRFTGSDVTRTTGLSMRAFRALIASRALNTFAQRRGRGHVRECDETALKRAAVIAALNRAGLSLAAAGQIAYFIPFHTLLFTVCDPRAVLKASAWQGPLPSEGARRKVSWFDANTHAQTEPGVDWTITIYEGRFVSVAYGDTDRRVFFGDLRDDGSRFVAWRPSHDLAQLKGSPIEQLANEILPYHRFAEYVAEVEDPTRWLALLHDRGYASEQRDATDNLRILAENTARNTVFITTINVTLALRQALRRYLGMEPPYTTNSATG